MEIAIVDPARGFVAGKWNLVGPFHVGEVKDGKITLRIAVRSARKGGIATNPTATIVMPLRELWGLRVLLTSGFRAFAPIHPAPLPPSGVVVGDPESTAVGGGSHFRGSHVHGSKRKAREQHVSSSPALKPRKHRRTVLAGKSRDHRSLRQTVTKSRRGNRYISSRHAAARKRNGL